MGAMAGPIIGGHLMGLTGTFGWAVGRNAFVSLFAGFYHCILEKTERVYQDRGSAEDPMEY